ncbi:unnamed protein product, partial [Iphiclides podalirius]
MMGMLLFGVLLNLFSVALSSGLKLEQVLVLSRHNIRTPLTAKLEDTSPFKFPIWKNEVGHLTDKGALLETYMGGYFAEWLNKRGLLPPGCPTDENVFVYANTRQRTRESANAFVRGAFRNCNVSAHSIDSAEMDPVFNPILRDTSDEVKRKIIAEMERKLMELQLQDAYLQLNEILDLKNSKICETESFCDLTDAKDEIVYVVGSEPNVVGPLAISNSVLDSFIMSYYEGMPDKDVAWGKIHNNEQWTLLSKIIRENQNVRFNSSVLARDVAKPLLKYIRGVFNGPLRPLTVLFGHDSNLNSIMAALGFKHYILPNQYEATPPGGKIVFQKWSDEDNSRELLKIDYVYQTTDQIRNASKLSISNPPQWVQLELRNCTVDKNGFCPWKKFLNILN